MSELILPKYAEGEVVVPCSPCGELMTPYEASTGTPLPVVITQIDGIPWRRWDRHHANFEKDLFLAGTLGTRATCFSRLQYVPRPLHRRIHERNRIVGTVIPETVEEQFAQTVLGEAGYVPEWGMDLSGSDIQIVRLTPEQRDAIDIRTERKSSLKAEIGQFLMACVISQDLGAFESRLVDQFVSIKPREARRNPALRIQKERMAMRLIGKGIEIAVDPLEPHFQLARRERRLRNNAPVCAWLAVRNFVGEHADQYMRTLEYRLRLSYRSQTPLQTDAYGVELVS